MKINPKKLFFLFLHIVFVIAAVWTLLVSNPIFCLEWGRGKKEVKQLLAERSHDAKHKVLVFLDYQDELKVCVLQKKLLGYEECLTSHVNGGPNNTKEDLENSLKNGGFFSQPVGQDGLHAYCGIHRGITNNKDIVAVRVDGVPLEMVYLPEMDVTLFYKIVIDTGNPLNYDYSLGTVEIISIQ